MAILTHDFGFQTSNLSLYQIDELSGGINK